MSASIIAIGNPGAGKSTILNSLAGEILFKSGISFGAALTCQLDERENERGRFFDTPGLADDTHREAAARAISTALRKGGPFKIIFFVGLKSGRINRNDITTMKLVQDSAPEIGNKYGIIFNKLPSEVAEHLKDPNQSKKLLIKLFTSIPEEKRCALTNITYLPYRREADSKNNHLLHPNSLKTPEGSSIADFVNGQIETVQLTEGLAKDIKIGSFEETTKFEQILEKKLEDNKEMYKEQQRRMLENVDTGIKMSDGSSGRMYPSMYSSEEFSSTEESSSSIQPPMYHRRMAASIIAIGNPGAGKSTILNSLAGELLFKSDELANERGRFYDAPGLADVTQRESAGKAISTALRKGGPFKILFFVRLESGRIVREDITTFKLVLNCAPEIENRYGIITNKLPENVAKLLKKPEQAEKLLTKLFASIPEEMRCATSNMTYLPHRPEADSEDNYLVNLETMKTLDGEHFKDFVYLQVPTVQLTAGVAKDIEIADYDKMDKLIEAMEKRMEKDKMMFKEQQNLLLAQLEKAEEAKIEQSKKDQELFMQQMKQMTDLIKSKEKEIEEARGDAKHREQLQQEQMKNQLEYERQQFQKQQIDLAESRRPHETDKQDKEKCFVM